MKATLLCFAFIFISNPVFSQVGQHQTQVPPDPLFYNQLQYKDAYYRPNYRGIKSLMADLALSDERLHNSLLPAFDQLNKKRRRADGVLLIGGGASIVLLMIAVGQATDTDRLVENPQSSLGLMTLAGVVGGATALFYTQQNIRSEDILNFVNQFNRNVDDEPMRLTVGPALNVNQRAAGLSMVLTF